MNRTYQNCKLLIGAGRYEYDDMFNKLDLFLMMGRITLEQYVELSGMMPEPEPEPVPEPVDADQEEEPEE